VCTLAKDQGFIRSPMKDGEGSERRTGWRREQHDWLVVDKEGVILLLHVECVPTSIYDGNQAVADRSCQSWVTTLFVVQRLF
jgi:hypothetical protein